MLHKVGRHFPVNVPNRLIDRCRDHGERIVEIYQSGGSERSRSVGVPERRIDADPIAQMMGKICEVAGALSLGLNPDDAIRWDRFADSGWDFIANGLRVDVKGTYHPNGKRLILPKSKTHFFGEAGFEILLLVWAAAPESGVLGKCEARGWILKDDFEFRKTIIDRPNPMGLEIGSWILHQDALRHMGDLLVTA